MPEAVLVTQCHWLLFRDYLQTFERSFQPRFILMSYFIFLSLMILVLLEQFCLFPLEGNQSLFFIDAGNALQYRETVRNFNNQILIINFRFELPPFSKLSNGLSKYDTSYIYTFLSAFRFPKDNVSKISTKFYISVFPLVHYSFVRARMAMRSLNDT